MPTNLPTDLVTRLREFDWYGPTRKGADELLNEAADEIERLYKALAKANANHEHFEREWYLRGDEIGRLVSDSHELMQERNGLTTKVCELLLSVQQAQLERDCAVQELAGLKGAFDELGKHVFGGGWLDHAASCTPAVNGAPCSCGLTEWLKRFEKPLGLQVDVGAHCAHGIPINSPSACPSCHSEQPTRTTDP